MNDQKTMWNQKHAAGVHAQLEDRPREFAVQVADDIKPGMKLLELGCGVGSDSAYFASLGVDVVATDFSDVVIAQNKAKHANVTFEVVDIAKPLPYEAKMFDVVYAHLSLHYYDEPKTAKVFKEIERVLRPGGMLYFSCKSVDDPLFGDGTEIQPGVFEREGHIRHFFSLDYTKQLLSKDYRVLKLEAAEGVYDGFRSAFIQCWARKEQ